MNPPPATPARITLPRAHPDVQAAARAGHDLGLIEDNLNLTPAQRARNHDRALKMLFEFDRQREAENPSTEAERERRQREELISFSPKSDFLCIVHS